MGWRNFWKTILASTGPVAILIGAWVSQNEVTRAEWGLVGLALLAPLSTLLGPANADTPSGDA